jgi:MFS family permease
MHPDKESMRVALLLGQIVEGLAVGITDTQAMTYASETIPTSLRGPAMALNPAFLFLGQLVGAAIMIATGDLPGEWSYRVALASQWPLSLLIFVFAFVIPESPAYLIRKGNYDKAHRSISRLFTPQANPNIIYRRMRLAIEQESVNKSDASYKDCFIGVDLRRTMVVIVTNLYTGAAGLPLLSSASYFLRRLGMEEEPAFMVLLIGIAVAFLSNVVGLWLLPKFGRRQLILIGFPIICVLWTAVGISGFWRTTPIATFTAVVFVAIAATIGLLIWPAGYAIGGEASSLRLRSKTQGVGGFANNALTVILNLVLPYAYNDDQGDLGGITALIYTFLTALMFVATWFIIPELKGRDVKEIDDMFELKLPTRAFKKWDGNSTELDSMARSS